MERICRILLFIIVLICIAVEPSFGRRGGGRFRSSFRSYSSSYSYYGSGGTSTIGTIIGAVVGGITFIVGIIILFVICRKIITRRQKRQNTMAMTVLSSNVQQSFNPPPYTTSETSYNTGMNYSTTEKAVYPPPNPLPYGQTPYPEPVKGFTMPSGSTNDTQPYLQTSSTTPYPRNGINTAPLGFTQPETYDSKSPYDNNSATQ